MPYFVKKAPYLRISDATTAQVIAFTRVGIWKVTICRANEWTAR